MWNKHGRDQKLARAGGELCWVAIFLDTSQDKKNSIHYDSVNTTCTLYKFPWRFYINISLGSDISGLCLFFNHATFFFQFLLNKAKCDDSERIH